MDYCSWNDGIGARFFTPEAQDRRVYLYVTTGIVREIGKSHSAGLPEFLTAIRQGPPWVLHGNVCERAYQTFSGTTGNDAQFHVFALDWTKDGMSFSRDGVRYAEVDWSANSDNRIFDPQQPMFMLLNLAAGGRIGIPSNETVFPVDLVVDYVRVRPN